MKTLFKQHKFFFRLSIVISSAFLFVVLFFETEGAKASELRIATGGLIQDSIWLSDILQDDEPPAEETIDTCYECHIELEDEYVVYAEDYSKSVHKEAGVSCSGCHGGDHTKDEMKTSMSEAAGFIGVPLKKDVPGICSSCHSDADVMGQYNLPTDQHAKYSTSVHGKSLEQGDMNVPTCADCHGDHDILKAADPKSPVYILNIPQLCSNCHSNPNLMESYDIPIDQLDVYSESVHGVALIENQDFRAPTCASCHGSHSAKPPESEEVINVCGKCHTATQKYYEESLHSRVGDASPKCWTCHGTHDVSQPSEDLFFHPEPPDQPCGSCHLDDENFRMDRERFAMEEDRRCDTCHHPDSWIMTQVRSLWSALTEAKYAYEEAEATIQEASSRGMIVTEAEVKLSEAYTSLVSARAALHTTKMSTVSELTDATEVTANEALDLANQKLNENLFRRNAMVIVLVVIVFNTFTLKVLKNKFDKDQK